MEGIAYAIGNSDFCACCVHDVGSARSWDSMRPQDVPPRYTFLHWVQNISNYRDFMRILDGYSRFLMHISHKFYVDFTQIWLTSCNAVSRCTFSFWNKKPHNPGLAVSEFNLFIFYLKRLFQVTRKNSRRFLWRRWAPLVSNRGRGWIWQKWEIENCGQEKRSCQITIGRIRVFRQSRGSTQNSSFGRKYLCLWGSIPEIHSCPRKNLFTLTLQGLRTPDKAFFLQYPTLLDQLGRLAE